VNIGQDSLLRIKDDNPLTVSLFYQRSETGNICNDGIGDGDFATRHVMAFGNSQNVVPVRLAHEDQPASADRLLDLIQVFSNIFPTVADRITGVETPVGKVAESTVPRENAMNKISIQKQLWIPKVYELLFLGPQKRREAFKH
jgi:hypothetical protein